jgi:hypothetical protein
MILSQRSRLFACLVFAAFSGWTACDESFAAMGESEAEVRRRYGEPEKVQRGGQDGIQEGVDRTMIFLVRRPSEIIEVVVGFIGGESVTETYFFMDDEGNPQQLSRDNVAKAERLVRESSQGHQWSPVPVHLFSDSDKDGLDDYLFFWSRSDNEKTTAAVQRDPGHALIIHSAEYKAFRDAAR